MRFGRNDIQKCLVSIEGKPILEYVLQAFAGANLRLIFLLTGFLQDQVNSYLTSSFGLTNDCVVTSLFGGIEGEAVAISRLRPFLDEDFIYAGGDVIQTPETVTDLIEMSETKRNFVATMTVSNAIHSAPSHPRVKVGVDNAIQSIALCDSEREALPHGPTDAGLYYFRPKALEYLAKVEPNRPMSEFVRYALRDSQAVLTYPTDNPWFALHTQDDLLEWGASEMRRRLAGL
jgi:NDP-sugar pyrophosphorylase family protein